jgi:deferrochelatase/peroxidase EfeB
MSGAVPTPEPQSILVHPTSSAIFLVLSARPGHEYDIRDVLAAVNGIRRSVGFRIPEARLSCVTGIGSQLWDRLFDGPRPAALHVLPEIAGERHLSVSMPGDLLFHIRASRPPGTTDRILDFSTAVTGTLFFVPASGFLDDPPATSAGDATDGSLRIGSLRPPR